ncbi:hypothetical protein DCL23_05105 [Citrobacter freundii]|nr:hypothetical protein DCL23_05105 [Citrobacter freundii]
MIFYYGVFLFFPAAYIVRLMCFMVLSFLINLTSKWRVVLICLIDLKWGICNDLVLYRDV